MVAPAPARDARSPALRAGLHTLASGLTLALALVGCTKAEPTKHRASASAMAASALASAPSSTAKADVLQFDTGRGEDRRAYHPVERWVPDVKATALQFYDGALWWQENSGLHTRALGGKARAVLADRTLSHFVVDASGLWVVEELAAGAELHLLPTGKTTTKKLHRVGCRVFEMTTTKNHVVVASQCRGIFALPKTGGAVRQLEREIEMRIHLASEGETLCYVNASIRSDAGSAKRVTCLSLADPQSKPQILPADDPSPLLFENGEAGWLEHAPAHDVILGGEFGLLVAGRLDSGKTRQLASQQHQSYGMKSDGKALYFFTEMGGLRRVLKDGSAVQTLHHIGRLGSPKLAIGGGYAYWSGSSVVGIHRLRLPAD
jgi:hypothetical protein